MELITGSGLGRGPVPDQEPEVRGAIAEIHQQAADLLCGLRPVRVRSHAEDMHVAGADLDHEEAVQALQGHRAVHVEEVVTPRRGAHILRHSLAVHLLRSGETLKSIGDVLGHRHPDTTFIYTK